MEKRPSKKKSKRAAKTPEMPGCESSNQEQWDRSRDDFNEEQMSTDAECGPVETDPVNPRDDRVKSGHIPGVLAS